jgi:transglutaminase-like putative cysteine protease
MTYLRPTPIIDWNDPAVLHEARRFDGGSARDVARRCFEWVRDEIKHSVDHKIEPVSCAASEVLALGSGLCYAKSHLLAALLRAHSIPAGLCYQRLRLDENGASFCLHGLIAVWLPDIGWYRADPRGNRADVDAQFAPPGEHLAFAVQHEGEADLPEVWPDALPIVVDALRSAESTSALCTRLPDIALARVSPLILP